jgi:hypothetical protein
MRSRSERRQPTLSPTPGWAALGADCTPNRDPLGSLMPIQTVIDLGQKVKAKYPASTTTCPMKTCKKVKAKY